MTPSRPQTGTRVSFKLAEVVCPERQRVASQIGPDLEIIGEIVFISDGEGRQDEFAIIEVAGLLTPVIVPMSDLTWSVGQSQTAKAEVKEG